MMPLSSREQKGRGKSMRCLPHLSLKGQLTLHSHSKAREENGSKGFHLLLSRIDSLDVGPGKVVVGP